MLSCGPITATATEEARLRENWIQKEIKCEGGGGRLPVPRSALKAGSMARFVLMYIRLVEGGRRKAPREANPVCVQNRLASRQSRFGKIARALGAGWPGAPSFPEREPNQARVTERVDSRGSRRLAREQRQIADTTHKEQAGSSRDHAGLTQETRGRDRCRGGQCGDTPHR